MGNEIVETPTEKPSKFSMVTQIVFLVLLLIAIGALIFACVYMVKYKDMLSNPIGYNMDRFNLKYCTCYDANYRIVPIKGLSYDDSYAKYIPKVEYAPVQYDAHIKLWELNKSVNKT